MDQLTSMAVFVRVAEMKSFAATASALDLSPTMVANHIRALEARLGAKLIERTTRRHSLTDIGLTYLERCRDVLSTVEAANSIAETACRRPEGRLRITAPISYGSCRLVPVLAHYQRVFPSVHVDLHLNDRLIDLTEEGFHIGIRSGHIIDKRLMTLDLEKSRMRVAASPDYLESHGFPVHPSMLTSHTCLFFSGWRAEPIWKFRKGEEVHKVILREAFAINNGPALLQAALAGAGIIIQPDVLLNPSIETGELIPLLPDWILPSRRMRLVYPSHLHSSIKLQSFVDFLSSHLLGEAL